MSEQVKGIPGAVLQAEQAHAKTCKGKNISDNELADNMRKLCATLCDVVEGWQKKAARSEQALAALEARNRELSEALDKYGHHFECCLLRVPRESRLSEITYDTCDCGLDAARAALKGAS